jgi:hypothetical protein
MRLEDSKVSSLAVELFQRGEAVTSCRDPADTGPGPIVRLLDDALAVLKKMDEEEELATRRRAASENTTDDGAALREFAKDRVKQQGFVPPAMRRRRGPAEA